MADLVADPAQDHAAVVDGPAGDPHVVGQVIAPRAHLRVCLRLAGQHAQGAAGPDGPAELARFDGSDADIDQDAVSSANDDGKANRQAQGFGRFFTEPLAVRRRYDRRQLVLGDTGIGQDFIVPIQSLFVVHTARAGSRLIDDPLASQMIE